MQGGVWEEISSCHPCVQGGCGGPLCLYGVPLVVSLVGDEDVGGCQFVHLGGVGGGGIAVILAALFLRFMVWGMM